MNNLNAPVSRRSVLRAGAGLAALGAASPLIAACGGGSGGSSGDTKTVRLGIIEAWVTPEVQKQLDAFEKSSGYKLSVVPISGSSGVELIQQFTPGFVSGKPSVDVMVISDEATPGFVAANWLEPLDDVVTDTLWQDYPDYIKEYNDTWSTKDGKTYRMISSFSVCLYFARQDLLTQFGADVPTTWDDLDALAEEAKGKGMYVYADAVKKPALSFIASSWLTLQNGGDIFAFDDGTKEAFSWVKSLMDNGYFPKESLGWTYDQSNASYTGDKILTMRQWNYFADVAASTTPWYKPEKTTVELPLAGPSGTAASYGGGWGMAVPAKASNVDGGKEFVKFMTDPSISTALASGSPNWSVPRVSNESLTKDNPQFQALAKYGDAGVMKPRPFHEKVNDAQSVVDDLFTAYLSGQKSLDDAMSDGASRIADLG